MVKLRIFLIVSLVLNAVLVYVLSYVDKHKLSLELERHALFEDTVACITENNAKLVSVNWSDTPYGGKPSLVIRMLDGNELDIKKEERDAIVKICNAESVVVVSSD